MGVMLRVCTLIAPCLLTKPGKLPSVCGGVVSNGCCDASAPRGRYSNRRLRCCYRQSPPSLARAEKLSRADRQGDRVANTRVDQRPFVEVCAAATGRLAWSVVEFVYWVLN